jgi:Xylose isomerase-like TIM barrel
MATPDTSRRRFLRTVGTTAAVAALAPWFESCGTSGTAAKAAEGDLFFKISLAEWSLHKSIYGGKITNLDFPVVAKKEFGIEAVEYVNSLFMGKGEDKAYLRELKMRCDDNGVRSVLIMCDGEGDMGHLDQKERIKTVENHKKWLEAAKFLGCHAIRVNAYGDGPRAEVATAAVDGLSRLTDVARTYGLKVMVENHGSYSSEDGWLTDVMRRVNKKDCGILPDFGNFCYKYKNNNWEDGCEGMSDRYKLTKDFMPFAHGVSAKSNTFDAQGNCIETDYRRMLKIVKDAGYRGHIGIEFEGEIDEYAGIRATRDLLMKVGKELG